MNGKAVFRRLLVVCGLLFSLQASDVSVHLHSGGRLTGKINVTGRDRISLDSYWAQGSVSLPLQEIRQVVTTGQGTAKPQGVEVESNGGTRLWLQQPGVEEGRLTGTSSWGDSLSLPLHTVEQVFLSSSNRAVRQQGETPERLRDPWPRPLLLRQSLVPPESAQLVYEVDEWPDRFLLEIDVKESAGDTRFQMLCSGPDPSSQGRFLIRSSPHRVIVTMIEPDEQNQLRSRNAIYPLQPGQSMHPIRILGNLHTGDMQLQVGNGNIMEWTMQSEFLFDSSPERPSTLVMQDVHSGNELDVRMVSLLPWRSETFPPLRLTEPGIVLNTGEQISGTVQEINAERIVFEHAENARIQEVTRDHLYAWRPAPELPQQEGAPLAVVRSFQTGEVFHFKSVSLEPGTSGTPYSLKGELMNGAELTIPSSGIHLLQTDASLAFPPAEMVGDVRTIYAELLNGDMLSGEFLGLEKSAVLLRPLWKGAEPLRIRGDAVRTLKFPETLPSSRQPFVLWLKRGGRLLGDVLSLSEEVLQFRSNWGNTLTVDRSQVSRLERRDSRARTVSLLRSTLEGWSFYDGIFVSLDSQSDAVRVGPAGWQLLREGVYLHATEPLPSNRVMFSLELVGVHALSNGMVTVEINGFSDEEGRARQVKLRISAKQIRAEIFERNRNVQTFIGFPSFEDRRELPLTLRVNDLSHELRIEIGNRLYWTLPIEDWGFTPEKMPFEVRISLTQDAEGILLKHLRVQEGSETPLPEFSGEDPVPGQLMFSNGDKMTARVRAIESGRVSLLSENGTELSMPLERIAHLSLAEPEPFSLRRKASHVRIALEGGEEEFLAELLDATATHLTVRREGIEGLLRLPVEKISEVTMNPYYTP